MATKYEYQLRNEKMEELKNKIKNGEDVDKNFRLVDYYERLQIDALKSNGVSLEDTYILKVEFNKYKEVIPEDHAAFTIKFDKWGEIVDEIVEKVRIDNTKEKDLGEPDLEPFGLAWLPEGETLQALAYKGNYRGLPVKDILNKMSQSLN